MGFKRAIRTKRHAGLRPKRFEAGKKAGSNTVTQSEQSYGLENIILHHSFKKVEGRTIKIACRERTHIGGVNGAGKTSVLQLIPAFYGEEPERIITQTSDRDSFVRYYLPSLQSLIIFEYRRHTGLCCAVMYRHAQGKLAYRFVEGGVEETFFRPDIKEALINGSTADTIFSELSQSGVGVSRMVNTITDYRAIIQRNPKLLKRQPAEAKKLRALANDFSLGDTDSRMAHIDRLTYVLLNKSRLLSSFKTMLCDTMFDHLHINKRPEILDERDLVNDILSIKAFEQEEPKIRDCLIKEGERKAIREQASRTVGRLRASVEEGKETRQGLQRQASKLKSEAEDADERFQRDDRHLGQQVAGRQHEVDTHEAHLKKLYDQNAAYEDKGLPEKEQQLANRSEYQRKLKDAEADFQVLTSKVNQLESEHNQQISEIRHTFDKEQARRKDRIAMATDALKQAGHEHEQQLARLDNKATTEVADYRESRHAQRRELDARRVSLETQRDNPGQTPEETRKIQETEAKVAELDDLGANISERQTEAVNKREQARHDRNTAQERLNNAEQTADELDQEFNRLQEQINPGDDTWLAALRVEDPAWTEGLARVVHPDLLMRPDLNPTFQESPAKSLMGWTLDLDRLPTPDIAASEEKQMAILAEKDQQRQQARRVCEEAEKAAQKRNQMLQDREREAENLNSEKRILDNSLNAARTSLAQVREGIQQAQQQRLNAIAADLRKVCEQIQLFDQDTEDTVKAINERYSRQRLEYKGQWADKKAELEAAQSNAKALFDEAAKEHSLRIDRLNKAYAQQLEAEGVDSEIIRRTREAKEALAGLIAQIDESEPLVREYRSWRERDWSQVERLQAQCAEHEKERDVLSRQQREARKVHEQRMEEARNQVKAIKSRLDGFNQKLEAADNILRKFDGIPVLTAELPGDLSVLTRELQDAYAQLERLRTQVVKAFRNAVSVLSRYENTQVFRAWRDMRSQQIAQLSDAEDAFDEDVELAQVENLRTLLEQHLPHLRLSLTDQFTAEADKVADYHDSLNVMGSQVKQVANTLRRAINTDQQIESLTDIEVVLEPRIYEDESWAPLKNFVDSWRTWKLSHRREIPSDALVQDFRQVISTLGAARMGDKIESMVDMTIKLKENNRPVHIRNDNDFLHASSTGLTYLAITAIFMGLTRYLAPDLNTRITWPIDELGTLSDNNIAKLAAMLEQHNLTMISACPKLDHSLRKFFENKVSLRDGRVNTFRPPSSDDTRDPKAFFDQLAKPSPAAQEDQTYAQ
ncbi:ATP-binding protein [Marinobacter bryozoorum]|uniref:ATP-binding protein n=1 Tax=Marinobacter bryozoorum TaxID=256324 RepID=UPI0020064322|nr:ATP-binding protein [Marinobacter bryozoorum]MCK7546154.1 ATP-binding protein [Marinobacter bryozoorum]